MTKLASAALAFLLAGPALAEAPSPATPPPAGKKAEAPPAPAKPKDAKTAKTAKTPAPKAGAPAPKDAPCEPVKPCPIE
ncbi:MAG TPA: hypothetical protein VLT61_08785 [Anaeromyxobacteraceae bacterium]|nr:hypothetical protein [Anaeromyxobacteraceae bacterium]